MKFFPTNYPFHSVKWDLEPWPWLESCRIWSRLREWVRPITGCSLWIGVWSCSPWWGYWFREEKNVWGFKAKCKSMEQEPHPKVLWQRAGGLKKEARRRDPRKLNCSGECGHFSLSLSQLSYFSSKARTFQIGHEQGFGVFAGFELSENCPYFSVFF